MLLAREKLSYRTSMQQHNAKMSHIFSSHQEKQVEIINKLEDQINSSSLTVSTVAPVDDYENDTRICLTSVHIPSSKLIDQIQNSVIKALEQTSPDMFYYPSDSLHITIKNIRVINDPPHFTDEDIQKAKAVFASVIPRHKKFRVYFYRLLLFPNNLALVGTTDPELDSIILDVDNELNKAGIPDDKKYLNLQFFFSNMTIARFNSKPTAEFIQKVSELSDSLVFEPYMVDSVTLATANAVFTKRSIIETWKLQ